MRSGGGGGGRRGGGYSITHCATRRKELISKPALIAAMRHMVVAKEASWKTALEPTDHELSYKLKYFL